MVSTDLPFNKMVTYVFIIKTETMLASGLLKLMEKDKVHLDYHYNKTLTWSYMTETTNQHGILKHVTKMLLVINQLNLLYKVMETVYFIILKDMLFGVLELTMDKNHLTKEVVLCAD